MVSGISYRFDPKAAVGSRVSEVKIGGQPLEAGKTYKLAVSSFAAGGGDGYTIFQGAKVLVTAANGQRDVVALTDYLRAQPTVAPKVEGRISQP
ncbi:5'-nucleotidase C-terminal domain-containing protein [Deinococcus sp.]|uniref:5'-nucleotidase C-terminal domain-containing protein n=1 Tax=Deinococcus sp. TaxID=47478 RepID=UPI0025B98999|nr:5'-nucleotidase C-terminal domain-containing protein [Deinococcus sp.]